MSIVQRGKRIPQARPAREPHGFLEVFLVDRVLSLRRRGFETMVVGNHRRSVEVLLRIFLSNEGLDVLCRSGRRGCQRSGRRRYSLWCPGRCSPWWTEAAK